MASPLQPSPSGSAALSATRHPMALPPLPVREWLRDALMAGFVALVLGLPLVGLTTVDKGGALQVQTRWWALTIMVVVVFAGRFGFRWLHCLWQHWQMRRQMEAARVAPRRRASDGTRDSSGAEDAHPPGGAADMGTAAAPATTGRAWRQWVLTGLGWLLCGVAVVLPFAFPDNRYVVDLATTVMIYVMLGWGLNVVVGLAGLLDLGYVAFYAVGAYTYALLSTQFGWGFWEALPVSGLAAAGFGILLGWPTLRLRGDYLAIVTLGFGEIIRVVLVNWTALSGGPNGIASIPRPSLFGLQFRPPMEDGPPTFAGFFGLDFSPHHRIVFLYYLILVLALLTHLFVSRMRRLPMGRAWEAMREDEIACQALGIHVTNVKLSAFALGAMLGGFAGVFFAARQGFISPESFVFSESAIILAIVVLGGMGSQLGVVLAAVLLVLIPELGREFSEYRMLIFGAAMVLIMVWKPGGLLSHREPTLRAPRGGQRGSPASSQVPPAPQVSHVSHQP